MTRQVLGFSIFPDHPTCHGRATLERPRTPGRLNFEKTMTNMIIYIDSEVKWRIMLAINFKPSQTVATLPRLGRALPAPTPRAMFQSE